MQFRNISVKGFEGIGHNPGIELAELKHRNILIGPNNVGKSTFFRCMHLLQTIFQNDLPAATEGHRIFTLNRNLANSIWWREDFANDIQVSFTCEGTDLYSCVMHVPSDDYGRKLVHSNKVTFDLFLSKKPGSDNATAVISPHIDWITGEPPMPIVIKNGSQCLYLTNNKDYTENPQLLSLVSAGAHSLLKYISGSQRFFDPIRSILKPAAGEATLVDGSGLLPDLFHMQQDDNQSRAFEKLREEILSVVNKLLESTGAHPFNTFSIKGTAEVPRLSFKVGQENILMSNMGTGISELFFLCASLLMDKGRSMQYFLEEPETHMHPGLLRRLCRMFSEHQDIQFFINTHSNVLLDDITDGDRVYLWSRNAENHESSARPCAALVDHHQILDDLGIRASSLMQTNCVIWVEGPSDRIYVKRWLDEIGVEKNDLLIEGSDYTVVIYGGALLANFELDDSESDKLISMINLSRYAVVLMDRDLAPGVSDEKLKPRVKRILEGAKFDPDRRLAILTIGREIENDIDKGVFLLAAKQVLKTLEPPNQKFASTNVIPGQKNYFDEFAEYVFPDDPDKIEKASDRLSDKVRFAEQVIKILDNQKGRARPSYVQKIYSHVKKSRLNS